MIHIQKYTRILEKLEILAITALSLSFLFVVYMFLFPGHASDLIASLVSIVFIILAPLGISILGLLLGGLGIYLKTKKGIACFVLSLIGFTLYVTLLSMLGGYNM